MIFADIVFVAACVLLMGLHYAVWRKGVLAGSIIISLTGLLPVFAAFLSLIIADFDVCLVPAYLAAALYSLSFAAKSAKRSLPILIISVTAAISSFLTCSLMKTYREPTYLPEFEEMFTLMRRHYVLGDYKQIDWDGLYEKYQPQAAALGADSDLEFQEICYRFGNEFPDPHIQVLPNDVGTTNATVTKIAENICGKSLGFCGLRLTDGKIVAVNVDENCELYKSGLHNGCELLSFNGTEINEYISSTNFPLHNYADIDNLEFEQAVLAFGIEDGSSAEVTFKTEDGNTVTAEASASGENYLRSRETMRKINGFNEDDYNMKLKLLDDGTACIVFSDVMELTAQLGAEDWERIREMWDVNRTYSAENAPYPFPEESIIMGKLFDRIDESGADKLILDLRNNGGGNIDLAAYLISYFTDEDLFVAAEKYTDTAGNTVITVPVTTGKYKDETRWNGGQIVILLSQNSASAAEIFTRAMSKLPNVTVMGFTQSAGCAMGVSEVFSEHLMYQFPQLKMVDENGDILIDSDADMQQSLPLDIQIPLDEDAVEDIFVNGNDHAMSFAQEYLNKK